ncbi:hypothetical protein F2Q70_00010586 [Brassica cretica]|uniref:Uncharacterized protein n=1 Tax=Brassica cretica TaxID=69181 RepID=A0A8S9M236_BRACR|nr:hypothetical protein F2Q70_00010586 [Brassica cretica]
MLCLCVSISPKLCLSLTLSRPSQAHSLKPSSPDKAALNLAPLAVIVFKALSSQAHTLKFLSLLKMTKDTWPPEEISLRYLVFSIDASFDLCLSSLHLSLSRPLSPSLSISTPLSISLDLDENPSLLTLESLHRPLWSQPLSISRLSSPSRRPSQARPLRLSLSGRPSQAQTSQNYSLSTIFVTRSSLFPDSDLEISHLRLELSVLRLELSVLSFSRALSSLTVITSSLISSDLGFKHCSLFPDSEGVGVRCKERKFATAPRFYSITSTLSFLSSLDGFMMITVVCVKPSSLFFELSLSRALSLSELFSEALSSEAHTLKFFSFLKMAKDTLALVALIPKRLF